MNLPSDSPVIIIGAARSGTNMLRDVLCSIPGLTTWPCDEIPYIWRHGNRDHPDDEFSPDMARPDVQRYILNQFRRIRIAIGFSHRTCEPAPSAWMVC